MARASRGYRSGVEQEPLFSTEQGSAGALIPPRPSLKSRDRGTPVESDLAPMVMATVHPSSILRSDNREAEMQLFVEDLRRVAEALRAG